MKPQHLAYQEIIVASQSGQYTRWSRQAP